jgi:LysM repeat protein
MRQKFIYLLGLVFLLILMVFPANPSAALEFGSIGISPVKPFGENRWAGSYFMYKEDKGKSLRDALSVVNLTDKPMKVKLTPLDAVLTPDGGFSLARAKEENRDLGSWIILDEEKISLQGKETKEVGFTLKVPENANVGDHVGGIAMEEDREYGGIQGVNIQTRVGVRVYLTVPGELIRDIRILQMGWDIRDVPNVGKRIHFVTTIENKGNLRFDVKGKAEVKNIIGRSKPYDWEFGTTFPNTQITVPIRWDHSVPIIGRFVAKITIPYDPDNASKVTTAKVVFWIVPWQYLTIILAAVIIFFLIKALTSSLKKIVKKRMPIYTVKPNDNLLRIAEKFDVHWKKIAKVNSLKEPYHVQPGQKLRIPKLPSDLE